jgi:hypothetical protein
VALSSRHERDRRLSDSFSCRRDGGSDVVAVDADASAAQRGARLRRLQWRGQR